MELAQLGNVYFDAKKPWQDAKREGGRPAMETTIACCLECIKALALIGYPILPHAAEKIWRLLGFERSILDYGWEEIALLHLPKNQALGEPEILFKRVEDLLIEEEIQLLKQPLEKS